MENDLIVKLSRAVSRALECDNFFDVYDEEDAEEECVEYITPSVCQSPIRQSNHCSCNVYMV